MSELLPSHFAPMSLGSALLVIGALIAAYMVFTLAGFGTALFASAPLASVMPVAKVVPLLALLDARLAGTSFGGCGGIERLVARHVAWAAGGGCFAGSDFCIDHGHFSWNVCHDSRGPWFAEQVFGQAGN